MDELYTDFPENAGKGTARVICTPSPYAKKYLFYIHEAVHMHTNEPVCIKHECLDSFMFGVICQGSGTLSYNGKSVRLSEGQCFMIDCRKPYEYTNNGSLWDIMWVHFNGFSAEYLYKLFEEKYNNIFVPSMMPKIVFTLKQLISINTQTKSAYSELLTSHAISGLLTTILTTRGINENNGLSDIKNKLEGVVNYINANFTKTINLDKLSELFYISKYYLAREFKKEYGVTIIQYIISKRIVYAKQLLRFTDKPIDEISEICGFNDQSYFVKQFKRSEGVTCLTFRKMWRS